MVIDTVTSSAGRGLRPRPVYREAFLVENFFVYLHHKSKTCRSGGFTLSSSYATEQVVPAA